MNCTIEIDGVPTRLSLPTVLGALILKGAAFISDRKDTQRHLDDAAILASAIGNPIVERDVTMTENDPRRLEKLAEALENPQHRSWQLVPEGASRSRVQGADDYRYQAREPQFRYRAIAERHDRT